MRIIAQTIHFYILSKSSLIYYFSNQDKIFLMNIYNREEDERVTPTDAFYLHNHLQIHLYENMNYIYTQGLLGNF